jgi:peptide/nickel transport system substrate-binding protein
MNGQPAKGPHRRHAAAAAAFAAVTALAAACSAPSHAAPAASAVSQTVTSYGVADGNLSTLTWDLPYGEPNTIDPPNTAFYNSSLIAANLCDPLLRLNPNYSISPNLATYQQPNPLTLIFNIRPGVRFWDGSPVTSADVVWSLQHSASPSTAVSFLYANVKSITATGPLQVTVKFTRPDSLFLFEMSSFSGMVQEKRFAERAGSKLGTAAGKIMCSGPYELTSWTPGTGMTLTANPHYWNPADRAHAHTIQIQFDTDSTSIAQALISGQLDGAYEIPPAVIPRLRTARSGKLIFGAPTQLYLTLSVARPAGVLASLDVRKALWMTISRQALASAAYSGAATPNYTQMNLDSWKNASWPAAAQKIWSSAYAGFERQEQSWGTPAAISAAKNLAAKAGYHGQPIVLATLAGDATLAEVAGLIQGWAQEAGLNVQIKPLQPLAYDNASYSAQYRTGLDLLLGVTFNVAPNPLEPMGLTYTAGDPYNYTNYSNSQVTADINAALATSNLVEQARLLTNAQSIYEPAYWSQTLLQFDEILFLKNGLGGATASFAYLNEPSLALIGKAAN